MGITPCIPFFLASFANCHCSFKGGLGEGGVDGKGRAFFRHFNDWEFEDAKRLLSWIWETEVFVERDDTIWWVETKNGVFSTISMDKNHQLLSP